MSAQETAARAPQASQQAQTANGGFDLIETVTGVLFAPGRALVSMVRPGEPSVKDLPLIIGLSAGFWWAAWWAFNKYYLEAKASEPETVVRIRKKRKTVRVVEDEGEDE